MNILITGGYGFIGSHTVKKFFDQGHKVFILDNLISGDKSNVIEDHQSFIMSINDKDCEKIFLENRIDIVVHLAAQINVTTSINNPVLDTSTNVLGLVNILNLSSKYKVKKFVFASSAAVYGNNPNIPLKETEELNPISPYALSKLIGEKYCKLWKDLYGLDTVSARFSNVYGPKQGTVGEGGVVSIFMEGLSSDKKLCVFGDGNQTRDFIYVEDIVEGLYKISFSDISGVYNLSTSKERTLNDLLDILRKLQKPKEVEYTTSRDGDIYKSSLDNKKVKDAIDWEDKFTLEEGIKNTYLWYSQKNK
jgi:nucleoside-diphosphate-sugar epimerase